MKINIKAKPDPIFTHGGGIAQKINAQQELWRSVMACMLWEDTFYESGKEIAARIQFLVPQVDPLIVSKMAVEARTKMKLRHVPLLLVREMARYPLSAKLVSTTLPQVIRRADELAEFLAIYWKEGKTPISKQVKLGLARSFQNFDAYQFAKYNRDSIIKLRDVMFLVHPTPKGETGKALFNEIANDTLPTPDTWEVALSAGKDKKETWIRLIEEGMLGGLALLRNLRNMLEVQVPTDIIEQALANMDGSMILPFRYVSAAKAAPRLEQAIDTAMIKALQNRPKLPGKTVVIIDVSGSMYGGQVSAKSDMNRALAASALAAIAREMCEDSAIYATAGSDLKRIHATALVPPRHGMALVDAIYNMSRQLGGGGIFLNQVCNYVTGIEMTADRTIVITDEQDCSIGSVDAPKNAKPLGKGYLLNVSVDKNGIGYDKWTHIDGWSEAVLDYIAASESVVIDTPAEQ